MDVCKGMATGAVAISCTGSDSPHEASSTTAVTNPNTMSFFFTNSLLTSLLYLTQTTLRITR